MTNRIGLKGHPCRMPVEASKMGDSCPASETKKSGALYMDMIASTMGAGMPTLCKDDRRAVCSTLSKACFQSTKNRCRGEAFCLNKSWGLLIMCMGSLVDLAALKPY